MIQDRPGAAGENPEENRLVGAKRAPANPVRRNHFHGHVTIAMNQNLSAPDFRATSLREDQALNLTVNHSAVQKKIQDSLPVGSVRFRVHEMIVTNRNQDDLNFLEKKEANANHTEENLFHDHVKTVTNRNKGDLNFLEKKEASANHTEENLFQVRVMTVTRQAQDAGFQKVKKNEKVFQNHEEKSHLIATTNQPKRKDSFQN